MADPEGARPFALWFQSKLGATFPLVLDEELVPASDNIWVSPKLEGLIAAPPMTPSFDDLAGKDLGDITIAGLFGHGVASSAFYFVHRAGTHRRFFRLAYGGAYSEAEQDAEAAVAYLRGYRDWTTAWGTTLTSSTLLHNMGVNRAELTTAAGELVVDGPDEGAAWWTRLSQQLGGDPEGRVPH